MSSYLASKQLLCALDPKLAETASQMETTLARDGPRVAAILASLDLTALQAKAAERMGRRCVGAHLLSMGGYNLVGALPLSVHAASATHTESSQVFVLPFDDGTDVLARLRIPGDRLAYTGIAEHDLAERFVSEVATLRFLKTRVPAVPVPEVYHWDADAANPVGTRYMLMQRVRPVPLPHSLMLSSAQFSAVLLAHVVDELDAAGRRHLVAQIARLEAALRRTPLPAIGMLTDETGTVGPLGPSCTGRHALPADRGPFASAKQLLLACVDTELRALAHPTEYAAQWFRLLHAAIDALTPARWFPPLLRLTHTDFQDGNVLVASAADPTVVAVLDWEGARVLPAWDTRDGCHVAWMYWEWFPPEEKGALLRVYDSIAPAPGGEGRHWRGLLAMLEARPALGCDRVRLDRRFLEWFAGVEGKGWGAAEEAELEGFRRLREFIQVSPPVSTRDGRWVSEFVVADTVVLPTAATTATTTLPLYSLIAQTYRCTILTSNLAPADKRPAAFASRGLQSVAEAESTAC
ncbi:hypothetical protein DFH09DRAFT_1105232 [Mycena vulgaris]|nr:hypothetical protein DFH09DRAFT_1105232 [Mycena vulgaris]